MSQKCPLISSLTPLFDSTNYLALFRSYQRAIIHCQTFSVARGERNPHFLVLAPRLTRLRNFVTSVKTKNTFDFTCKLHAIEGNWNFSKFKFRVNFRILHHIKRGALLKLSCSVKTSTQFALGKSFSVLFRKQSLKV